MDAMEAITRRRSTRSFTGVPVPSKIIERIVDAGRLAATARNMQPWEFVVVTNAETRRALAQLATTGPFIADAPVCIALFCSDTKYWLEDGCAATQNVLVAARAYGLGQCWVAGEKKPYAAEVSKLLGAPAGYHLVSLIAIGYAKEEPPSPPKRPLEEVLHWEKF